MQKLSKNKITLRSFILHWLLGENAKTYEETLANCLETHLMTQKMANTALRTMRENKRIIRAICTANSLDDLKMDVLNILKEEYKEAYGEEVHHDKSQTQS